MTLQLFAGKPNVLHPSSVELLHTATIQPIMMPFLKLDRQYDHSCSLARARVEDNVGAPTPPLRLARRARLLVPASV